MPSPAPFIYCDAAEDDGPGGEKKALVKAALDGNLRRVKVLVKSLTKGKGGPESVFSVNKDGIGVLHAAACTGQLEVCKYLVEKLGGDVNAPGCGTAALGATPFMTACQSGDVPTVKYLLDRGGDLTKADEKGRTALHHAASTGSCKVTEFLLSQGVPVDIDCGRGTPLYMAATNEKDKTLKILLDHKANPNIIISGLGSPLLSALIYRSLKCMKLLIKAGADVNSKGSMMNPLLLATMHGGYTNYIKLLLKAGADPNIPDDLGRLPIELAALRDCWEEVEMLFPLTTRIPDAPVWSIEGVISHAKIQNKKPMEQQHLERRNALLKSQADTAFKQKEYKMAIEFYGLAIAHGESATLYANRSLCKLLMGDGDGALSDALKCRMLRPKWSKACYRQAAAHMLLKEYKQACDAFEDAQKMAPGNAEIESELRKARELMKNPPGDD
ncbi:hypothetical protein QYE76_050541 [Lolium multiflorum]|uniref:Serine/threonine-protein kinase BSK1-like TPR repeats domain-containing protein n=1 Tax=Lolium multiflorum TaxID=4521 RepID=A0AAD8SQ57_LOLMU|nr:hypothetical protein QYE76_050541 [Lolium multiflorum]